MPAQSRSTQNLSEVMKPTVGLVPGDARLPGPNLTRSTTLHRATRTLLGTALLLSSLSGSPQEGSGRPLPTLRFDPPVGFNRVGGDLFTPNSYHHASVKIYFFRPFSGKLEDEVATTLMRDWERELNRQVRYVAPPQREKMNVPGSDAAMVSVFAEDYFGTQAMNIQVSVVKSQALSVIYVWADREAWQYYHDALDKFLKSIKVEAEEKPPAATSSPQQNAARRSIAGLYLGQWMTETRFYLLSEDGRFYRGHRLPSAPGGDIRRFDYQHAREIDPDNSGTYKVAGSQLIFEVAGQNLLAVPLPVEGNVKIEGITYKRQTLSK